MTPAPRQLRLLGCVALAAAGLAPAAPRELIDRELTRTPVDLLGWTGDAIAYLDGLGQVRRDPASRFVAILPGGADPADGLQRPTDDELAGGTPVVIELVDGQRLLGSLGPWNSASISAPAPADDTLSVLTGFGAEALSLEKVARIAIDPWASGTSRLAPWDEASDDELVLLNGDRVRGFLVAIDESVVFDAGGGEQPFPLNRVAEIRLGNPAVPPGGPRVWWADGTIRAATAGGDTLDGSVRLVDPAGGAVVLTVDELRAAWLDEDRLIPLAALEIAGQSPLAGRRWSRPAALGSEVDAPLGTPHIELDGPVRVRWELPAAASRFGAIARLGGVLDDPMKPAGRWADAEVRVAVVRNGAETELLRVPLTRSAPSAPLASPLPGLGEHGRELVIEVLEARHGPIQDRVLLDRPMLLGM
jgi:hypothetical protein